MAEWLRALAEWLRPGARRSGPEESVSLAQGGTWSVHLHGGENLALTCGEGLLWLTLEGDSRDYVLSPGHTLPLEPGHVVVQALRAARFRLATPPSDARSDPPPHRAEAHAR